MNPRFSPDPQWFVLYTLPNFEKKIALALQKKDIKSFLPMHKIIRNWSDRKKVVDVVLFPNYLFVYTTFENRFKILELPGTARYVSFNGLPVTISEHELTIIRKMTDCPGVAVEEYLKGDSVKIVEGPFSGLIGVVFERKGKKRLGVTIKSLNRSLSAEFDILSVKKENERLVLLKN
jgi:transcriptional antiterminator RfaH